MATLNVNSNAKNKGAAVETVRDQNIRYLGTL